MASCRDRGVPRRLPCEERGWCASVNPDARPSLRHPRRCSISGDATRSRWHAARAATHIRTTSTTAGLFLVCAIARHARFVAQSEWRLAPSATSRLSIRCWTSSRSSTVSELMSSLRRRPQINRALHWPNHLHATLRATFHRRRVRPTRATTTGRRTACSSWLARSRASTGADLREVGRHNAICASSGHHQLNGAARCVVDTI